MSYLKLGNNNRKVPGRFVNCYWHPRMRSDGLLGHNVHGVGLPVICYVSDIIFIHGRIWQCADRCHRSAEQRVHLCPL